MLDVCAVLGLGGGGGGGRGRGGGVGGGTYGGKGTVTAWAMDICLM